MEEYERLFFEFRVRHQSFDFACSVSVKRILLMLGRMKGGDPLGILDRSLKYIHARLRHKISVGELAALEYLGESRYRELFRRETGMSPSEYIEAQRTERAKDMLDGGDMTVAEVALAVGYADPHYFQRVFKKREGMTPGAYRKLLEKPRKRQ